MSLLRFDGKVVLVTGAGNGLGKEYALAFGDRGAKVIVNDLGGDMKGEGKSSRPADMVVEQIKSKGGSAIANYDSVEKGENLIKCALDNFGRIDIIVNNAGILRDKTFARMTDEDWDIIHRIHLKSVFQIARSAWPYMKKQNYGRIIMISSASGIYGNFGQANYSAAKLGVFGLSQTLAIEGEKNNIFTNCIAPIAGSRMTKSVLPEDLVESLKPEYVAPLVLWLSHEDCQENGALFECGAGWIGKLRWERSKGAIVRKRHQAITPEDVRDKWEKILCFDNADHPRTIHEGNESYFKTIQHFLQLDQNEGNLQISADSESKFVYDVKDVILYALSVGVSTMDANYLNYLYENSEHFFVLPTYSVIASMAAVSKALASYHFKDFQFDPAMVLHGEQFTETLQPLKPSDSLTSSAQIVDILDKGSGAAIVVNVDSFDTAGEKVAFNQTVIFLQKAGNFGGARVSNNVIELESIPSEPTHKSVVLQTSKDQAALYRLNGDYNPLHIDPSFAMIGGFDQPILHGLCSYGFVAKEVIKHFCDNKVELFKSIKARFLSPILPGQSLQIDMWNISNKVQFVCKVTETNKVCLRGFVTIKEDAQKSNKTKLLSDKIFKDMQQRVEANKSLAQSIGAVYLFNISKDGLQAAEWTVSLTKESCRVYSGKPATEANCIINISDEDLAGLATGKLNGMQLFSNGRLKVSGNIMLSTKLGALFQEQSKL